jgi:hypothetical protein
MRTTKKITTDIMTPEDVAAVAEALRCSKRHVKMVWNGERGAQQTKLSISIIQAMDLRLEQKRESHKTLIKFCKSKRVKRVVPQ